jgi:hypothetical protein
LRRYASGARDHQETTRFEDPWQRATEFRSAQRPGASQYRPAEPSNEPAPARSPKRRRSGLTVALISLIVMVLVAAGLVGGEVFARTMVDKAAATETECEIGDTASVRFALMPPLLWQYVTGHYPSIHFETGGNRIMVKGTSIGAQEMKLVADLKDVHIKGGSGTVGTLAATITWTAKGIAASFPNLPLIGGTNVATNPTDGTISLSGYLGKAIVKPVIDAKRNLLLKVTSVTGILGAVFQPDSIQQDLDQLLSQQTNNLPMGIHADNVEVTADGVTANFSTQNAELPTKTTDPCAANM